MRIVYRNAALVRDLLGDASAKPIISLFKIPPNCAQPRSYTPAISNSTQLNIVTKIGVIPSML